MRITFNANLVGFKEANGSLIAGVTIEDDPQTYLLISRSAADGNDDWGIHLEYADQASGEYNCISRCLISPVRMSIDLNKPPPSLKNIEGFDVIFDLDKAAFDQMTVGLQRIFRGRWIDLLIIA